MRYPTSTDVDSFLSVKSISFVTRRKLPGGGELLLARQFLITRCAGQDSICEDNYIILHIPSCVQRVAGVCLRW